MADCDELNDRMEAVPPQGLHVDLHAAVENVLRRHAIPVWRSPSEMEVLDVERSCQRLRVMIPYARHVLSILHPARPNPAISAVAQELLAAALRHDVPTRTLYGAESTGTSASMRFIEEATAAGIEVRTFQDLPSWLVIVGNSAVVWPRDQDDPDCDVVLLRTPGAVSVATWAFRLAWWQARPARIVFSLTAQDHEVLKCLSAGLKDDLAARRLQVSVRTYRRYVTKLCKQLDASSRFEAGAKAALQGLI